MSMSSHELARLLLTLPDLPVATVVHDDVYASAGDSSSQGTLKVGRLWHYSGQHIAIGNISKRNLNRENWHIREMYHGEAPWEEPRYREEKRWVRLPEEVVPDWAQDEGEKR